ncbi:MAG: hypothetical protein WB696_02890 [Chthoniobacterales bacterium]
MSQVLCDEISLLDIALDMVFEFVEVGGEVRVLGRSMASEDGRRGTIETSVGASEKERGPQAELGDLVAMGFRDSLDYAV